MFVILLTAIQTERKEVFVYGPFHSVEAAQTYIEKQPSWISPLISLSVETVIQVRP